MLFYGGKKKKKRQANCEMYMVQSIELQESYISITKIMVWSIIINYFQ